MKSNIARRFAARIRELVLKSPDFFYFLSIELMTFGIIFLLISLLHVKPTNLFAVALFVLPAMECAIATVNLMATRFFHPRKIPKLDFSKGIPRGLRNCGSGAGFADKRKASAPGRPRDGSPICRQSRPESSFCSAYRFAGLDATIR